MDTETRETLAHGEAAPPGRRKFFRNISYALGGLGAGLLGLPVVGFLLAPLLKRAPQSWVPVGDASSFEVDSTTLVTITDPSPLPWAGVTANSAAWLRRATEDEFVAFAINCTHLGCPVRWLADAEIFMCPCHGGVFYKDGEVAAGPPERPLYRYPVRVRDGKVELLTGTLPIAPEGVEEEEA